jgi:hypothetical protein
MMKTILTTLALATSLLSAFSTSSAQAQTFTDWKYGGFTENIGGSYFWKSWVASGFNNSGYVGLRRTTDRSKFQFKWNAPNYGLLPRIGKTSLYNNSWAKRVDSSAGTQNANFNMTYNNWGTAADHSIWMGIYGWLDSTAAPSWPYTVEFYVIENWDSHPPNVNSLNRNSSYPNDPPTQLPNLTVDGATYYVYSTRTAAGARQYISRRANKRTSGTVNVRAHLNHFRQHECPNDYIIEVTWAAEIFGLSDGQINYNSWSIADP